MGVRLNKMPKWGGAGADILNNTIEKTFCASKEVPKCKQRR